MVQFIVLGVDMDRDVNIAGNEGYHFNIRHFRKLLLNEFRIKNTRDMQSRLFAGPIPGTNYHVFYEKCSSISSHCSNCQKLLPPQETKYYYLSVNEY